MMTSRKFDVLLQTFLVSVLKVSLTVMMFLSIVGMLGVNISSFAALLSDAVLASGAALNGSLGNLATGVMLMRFKSFKVGDIIDAQDVAGVLTEIEIFCTTVLSPEDKTIILPRSALSTGVITNINTYGNLRVDFKMGIALTTDNDRAREIAIKAMLSHPNVLQTPSPEVNVFEVGNSMTSLAIRPYTKQENYWDVYFSVQEMVKKAFVKEDIAGPVSI